MKGALQSKSLWGVVSGREECPPKPSTTFPNLMTTSCPTNNTPSRVILKEGQELLDTMQSKEYSTWKQSKDEYQQWLNKDDATMGLMQKSIIGIATSAKVWDHLKDTYVKKQ
ncbi:hypothetical protein C0992_000130, partial [Termitomyces sp. T32_za158]